MRLMDSRLTWVSTCSVSALDSATANCLTSYGGDESGRDESEMEPRAPGPGPPAPPHSPRLACCRPGAPWDVPLQGVLLRRPCGRPGAVKASKGAGSQQTVGACAWQHRRSTPCAGGPNANAARLRRLSPSAARAPANALPALGSKNGADRGPCAPPAAEPFVNCTLKPAGQQE